MRYLITVVIAALSLNAFGQTDGWEYPFPYNPDGDTDGYIGLNDLLDLLSLYGNEYQDSFHYDDSGAILYLGSIAYNECYNQARAAEGNWRLLNTKDILKWGDYLHQEFDQMYNEQFPNGNSSYFSYYFHSYDKSESPSSMNTYYRILGDDQSIFLETGQYNNSSNGTFVKRLTTDPKHCFIVTEVRPSIEYHVCFGTLGSVKTQVNDSIINGWYIIGGIDENWERSAQAIWRWAE
jgi:hypothetical protein